MPMRVLSFDEAQPRMAVGDVIAFGGKAHFSRLIKMGTMSTVSHVGLVLREGGERIIEATDEGVRSYPTRDRIASYEGDVWWLPRRRTDRFDRDAYDRFLGGTIGKAYDLAQAMKAGWDAFDESQTLSRLSRNQEDFTEFFCSELVAAGLEVAGAVGSINASEVTPIELCRWCIYEDDYFALSGASTPPIEGYNSRPPMLDGD